MGMACTFVELTNLSENDLIAGHDRQAKHTATGVNYS